MHTMFLTSTAATIAAFALSSRLSMCDQTYYREVRPNDETLLVIRALDESVRTSDAAAPFAYPEWQPGSSRQPMAGQVVTVVEVIAQAVGVRQAMAAGSRVVLVPWAHDSGCEPIAWMSAPRWIPPGTEGFVAARLRARDKWAGRLPTFDVRDAWREPYTPARALTALGPLAEGKRVMTPAEYGPYYALFPTEAEWRKGAATWVGRMSAWAKANPETARKEPAAAMLERISRM